MMQFNMAQQGGLTSFDTFKRPFSSSNSGNYVRNDSGFAANQLLCEFINRPSVKYKIIFCPQTKFGLHIFVQERQPFGLAMS